MYENNPINNPTQVTTEEKNEDVISLMEIAGLFLKHWKWIVLGIGVALLIALLYLRYTTPVYNVTASVILKDEKDAKMNPMMGALDGLNMMGAVSNVENETYILKSRSLVRSVINRLDLHTSYIVKGRIKDTDLYTNSPVIVDMSQDDIDKLKETIEFSMQMQEDEGIRVTGTIDGVSIDTVFTSSPAVLQTVHGVVSFTRRPNTKVDYSQLIVSIQHPDEVIKNYRENLTVQPASRTASVMNLSINTPYPDKGRDFLNTLVEAYNSEAVADKNQEALNTQNFIDERIAIINGELSTAEQNVEQYKQQEGLTDLESDLQRDMQMGSTYEQQLVNVETQLEVVGSLNSYVSSADNINKTIPTNIGIEDPTLAATTSEYNRLLLERERLSQSMTDDNPAMKRLNEQIEGLRSSISSSIRSVQQGLQIQRRDARNQANLYGGRIGSKPTQEREFMELSREQQIKASLFLMLLEKREENALALAAYANKAKVLDEALLDKKVSPRSMIVLLAALMLGVLIPAGVIYLLDLLRYRIRTRSDVERISQIPILVDIPKHEGGEDIAVAENATDEINEAFRMTRTNLMLTLGSKNKVVVFTSTVSGEGKTFVALNTAISMSLLKKRVLLVGLDLRIPRLREYMNLATKDGITSYLSGFENNIDNLIVKSDVSEYLYILPAGPIPPNPAELLSRSTLDDAFMKLREEFDYIIIDSAPSSMVTDTLILNRVADTTVYVCRANYSSKGNLKFANDLMRQNKLKNMLLVVNDVDEFHTAYGYGYGYGYGKKKSKSDVMKRKK